MLFIGDIHGCFDIYQDLIKNHDKSIQLGDFGVGFPDWVPFDIPLDHLFLRGNHDNPAVCREHPNYLGDYGFNEDFFYISGAYSIDKDLRIIDVDWWAEEELSYGDWKAVIDLYSKIRPKTVISHDCPKIVFQTLFNAPYYPNRTSQAMDQLWEIHQPKTWIFAHYHVSAKRQVKDTLLVCLNINETFEFSA